MSWKETNRVLGFFLLPGRTWVVFSAASQPQGVCLYKKRQREDIDDREPRLDSSHTDKDSQTGCVSLRRLLSSIEVPLHPRGSLERKAPRKGLGRQSHGASFSGKHGLTHVGSIWRVWTDKEGVRSEIRHGENGNVHSGRTAGDIGIWT